MLNNNKKYLVLLLSVLSLTLTMCRSEESENIDLYAAESSESDTIEDILDLGMHPLGVDTAQLFIDSANLLLSISGNQMLNRLVDEIPKTALPFLRVRSNALHKAHHHNQHYLSAVQMYFGYKDQMIRCLYQAVSLCSADTGKTKHYNVDKDSLLFCFQNGEFSEATSSDIITVAEYQKRIKFRENLQSQDYRDFVSDSTEAGDTQAILYTHQELDSVLIGNSRPNLRLWNYAYRKSTSHGLKSRHSLLLSPDTFVVNKLTRRKEIRLPFKGRFANLANPCPPSCNTVTFKVN